nr:GTP pyrophosphokinase family protein [Streptococcus loxodontisalivarius]
MQNSRANRKGVLVAIDWEEFLDPYIQTVGELKIKLRGIRKQFRKQNRHSPIEFVTGRVKSSESILEKMALRGIKEENIAQDLQDIAGLRIMVQFVDDVDDVLELLRHRHDMKIVYERDYIRNMKASGYRSYHVVIEYPVDTIDGQKTVLAEIQIRTLAMNFWATIEHSLNYKYKGEFPDEIKKRLETTAKIALELDEEMRKIKEDIQEAQLLFDPVSRTLNDGVGNSDDTDELFR